jgi:hypothetical protein
MNHDGTLTSPVQTDFDWQNGEVEAMCYSTSWFKHKIGSVECSCGFYSYHTTEQALSYHHGSETSIMGTIEAYGHVTVGSLGMRSSKARIVGLVIPRTFWRGHVRRDRHRLVLANYPDVIMFQNTKEMARAFQINGRPKILA